MQPLPARSAFVVLAACVVTAPGHSTGLVRHRREPVARLGGGVVHRPSPPEVPEPTHEEHGHTEAEHSHAEGEHSHAEGEGCGRELMLSIMLLATMVGVMCIFYLVNFNDKNIQGYTWHILSMTISIFCAVFIYGGIHRILVWAILGPHHNEKQLVVLHLSTYVVLVLLLQVILWFMRQHRKQTHAWATVWAHMTGFAALGGFAGLQSLEPFRKSILWAAAPLLIAMAVLGTAAFALDLARQKLAAATLARMEESRRAEEREDEKEWDETVEETEDDAAGLCLGQLIVLIVCFAICGRLEPFEAAEAFADKTVGERIALLVAAVAFAAATIVASRFAHSVHTGESERGYLQKRVAMFMPNLTSMCMAFTLVYLGEWQFGRSDFDGPRIGGCMVVALYMTLFVLVLVFGLNVMRNNTAGKVMRPVVLGLGLVVGFLWERVFDIALEAIAEEHHMQEALVVTPISLAICIVVLPAWKWYVMPKAQQVEDEWA